MIYCNIADVGISEKNNEIYTHIFNQSIIFSLERKYNGFCNKFAIKKMKYLYLKEV